MVVCILSLQKLVLEVNHYIERKLTFIVLL